MMTQDGRTPQHTPNIRCRFLKSQSLHKSNNQLLPWSQGGFPWGQKSTLLFHWAFLYVSTFLLWPPHYLFWKLFTRCSNWDKITLAYSQVFKVREKEWKIKFPGTVSLSKTRLSLIYFIFPFLRPCPPVLPFIFAYRLPFPLLVRFSGCIYMCLSFRFSLDRI